MFPVGWGFGCEMKLFHGLPFALGAARFIAIEIARREPRATIQPADETCLGTQMRADGAGFTGEIGEDALGHVAREVGGIDLPQRRRIDEIGVTRDYLGKGGFRAAFGVVAEQLGIGLIVHLTH